MIEENTIANAELNTVLIKNENNQLVGNLIEGASLAAIRIEGPEATGTIDRRQPRSRRKRDLGQRRRCDRDRLARKATDNQVKRNFGAGNGGLFIDLGANGQGNSGPGPNDGIQAPEIDNAKLTGASGSGALPGAEIRVFRKATASPGEIESFLGEAKADGSGNWSVTYAAAIPGETQIAATQSGFEGTSELAFAKTEPAPKTGGGGSTTRRKQPEPKPKGPKKPSAKGRVSPRRRSSRAPEAKIHRTTVKFKFVLQRGGLDLRMQARPRSSSRASRRRSTRS